MVVDSYVGFFYMHHNNSLLNSMRSCGFLHNHLIVIPLGHLSLIFVGQASLLLKGMQGMAATMVSSIPILMA